MELRVADPSAGCRPGCAGSPCAAWSGILAGRGLLREPGLTAQALYWRVLGKKVRARGFLGRGPAPSARDRLRGVARANTLRRA